MNALKKIKHDPIAMVCVAVISLLVLAGILAPVIAPNDPEQVNMSLKYAGISKEYPLGNDYLGRCTLSRLIYGIRPSVLLVLAAMAVNIGTGLIIGLAAGYFKGKTDEIIMRFCDIMLSFPADVMVLAVLGVFGVGLDKILLAIVFLRWPWYARVFRTAVMKYTDKNYVQFAKSSGYSTAHIIFRDILPSVFPEVVMIASCNVSSLILSISGYSFLGLGVQAPASEWGMMLNEAKNAMLLHPGQMLPPGISIMVVCVSFAFLGDSIRDAMDSKHSIRRCTVRQSGGSVRGRAA